MWHWVYAPAVKFPPRPIFTRNPRIYERTLEKREQSRAKPNPQAAALLPLFRKFPDTLISMCPPGRI